MPIDYRWEPPSLRETRSPLWWRILKSLLIFIVVLIAVLYAAYLITQPSAPIVSEQRQEPITPAPSASAPAEAKPVYQSAAPLFDSKCNVVAGVISGSVNRVGNKVSFTFKNNGKSAIEGSYFEASGVGKKAYRQNSESVAVGKEISYTVDLDDVSKEIGIAVNSFVVLPIQNSKACFNQRMIVIK